MKTEKIDKKENLKEKEKEIKSVKKSYYSKN